MGKLYLLPNLLGDTEVRQVLPEHVTDILKKLRVFATENVKKTVFKKNR